MLLYSPPDRHCDPPLKAIFHRNAGAIRPAPGRSALLLIGVAIPVYNQDWSRFNGLFASLSLRPEAFNPYNLVKLAKYHGGV